MMKNTGKTRRIITGITGAAMIAALIVLTVLGITGKFTPQQSAKISFFGTVAVVVFLFVAMIVELCHSLKSDFYAYKNIRLYAGIFFLGMFAISYISFFAKLITRAQEITENNIISLIINFPEYFAYYAMPVVFVICFALFISNIALIRHEGFRSKNLLSIVLAVFFIGGTLLVGGLFYLLDDKVIIPNGLYKNGVVIGIRNTLYMFIYTMIAYLECVAVGTAIMGYKAAKHIPAYDKDYIIVLGCMIDKKGGLLPLLKERTNRAIRFGWDQEIATGKSIKYIGSGGQGPTEVISEGAAIGLYMMSHGVEEDEVLMEKKSRNTDENMKFSYEMILKENKDARIAFATTNFHVLRSGMIARKFGIKAEGISSRTKWYFWPNGFIREFFAILSMNKKTHALIAIIVLAACAFSGFSINLF